MDSNYPFGIFKLFFLWRIQTNLSKKIILKFWRKNNIQPYLNYDFIINKNNNTYLYIRVKIRHFLFLFFLWPIVCSWYQNALLYRIMNYYHWKRNYWRLSFLFYIRNIDQSDYIVRYRVTLIYILSFSITFTVSVFRKRSLE